MSNGNNKINDLSPVERGELNVQTLKNYLEGLRELGQTVPMNKNGEPHRTAIANMCDLPRGFLYTNKTAIRVLNEFLGVNVEDSSNGNQTSLRSEREVGRIEYLEQQLLRREQELATCKAGREEMGKRLAEAEAKIAHYQIIEEEIIKAGRRIIP